MPKTQIQCPNCKQPIVADIEQLYDVNVDPQAKSRLLNGRINVVQCPHCGYQGSIPTPIVYHDPGKEYLLTYFPPELNVPVMEQEKQIAPLINKVVNSLKQEERKGYLFKPQQMFTLQTLIEKVLEGEGITKEMLDAQRKRLELLQRMMTTADDGLLDVVKSESELLDSEFFTLLSRMVEAGLSARDEASVEKLGKIQDVLLENTEIGKQIKSQADEIEAARKALQEAGKELTREKLLELLIGAADNEVRLSTMVSMARPGLDYVFFQQLSEQIDQAAGAEKEKLEKLRTDLLEITKQIDEQLQERLNIALQNIDALLKVDNPGEIIQQNPAVLDDFFIQALNSALADAQQKKDDERFKQLQQLAEVIQQLVSPGYNPMLLDELMEAADDEARNKVVEAHKEDITPEFIESLSAMMMQLQEGDNQELAEKVRAAYRAALRVSMQRGMQAPAADKQ